MSTTIHTAPPANATPEERQSVLATLKRPRWLKTEVLAGLIGLFTVERGALVGGGSCGVGVSA